MKKNICLNIKQLLFIGTAVVISSIANAQSNSPSSSNNKVRSIVQTPGSPVEINYEDGRVAQVIRREKADVFRAPITLAENSCKNVVGLKCTFVFPFVRQQHAAIWKTHPTSQGKALEYSFNKDITFGAQTFITRTQTDLYDNVLRRIPGADAEKALNDKSLGRIECESDITAALPASREIIFWDETFENGNAELSMTDGFGARVNLVWRRLQNLEINPQGNVMRISRYKKAYGRYTDFYPLGTAYVLQMTFRSPNIEDANEELCQLKWDVNFSVYFTQVTELLSRGAQEPFNPAGYTPLIYTPENMNPFAQKPYSKEVWEQGAMK